MMLGVREGTGSQQRYEFSETVKAQPPIFAKPSILRYSTLIEKDKLTKGIRYSSSPLPIDNNIATMQK